MVVSVVLITVSSMTNIPDFLDPFNPESETFFGRKADGSIAVTVQVVFMVDDELGLRAAHLKDPDHGEGSMDRGAEAAALEVVMQAIQTAPWTNAGLKAIEARVRSGSAAGVIPTNQFTSNQ